MTCEEADCYEAAIISIRKDPFGKSDATRNLCSKHAPRYWAISADPLLGLRGHSEDVARLEDRIRALEAQLAVEKMQHSVTIADEHESRSEFQDRIRALEAERDDVVEARGEMARENVRLATELAEWRELYEFGLKDRNELLDRAQTAEAYAARNALRVIEVEAALRKHMDHHDGCESNDWSNESDWITTSFGFVLKSDECSCGANQLALELDPAAKAVVDGYASETKSAPGFCPECLMTGGHKLRCSKAETSDYGCTGCRSTPCICATLETLVDLKDPHNAHHPDRLKGPGLTAKETKDE